MSKLVGLENETAKLAFDTNALVGTIENVLEEARRLGASSAEAGMTIESGLSANVRVGEVETLEHTRDKGLGITVYFGGRKGSASTTDFSDKAWRATVKAACDIARHTAEDPCNGLAEADLMAREAPDLDLYHPWGIDADQAIEIAELCEAAALSYDKKIKNSEGASVNLHTGFRVLGNSHGFLGGYATSRNSVNCAVIAEDPSGMQRDYWYSISRDPDKLDSPEAIGEKAAKRALQRLQARKLATTTMPVVFQAEMARGLMGHFLRAINGNSLYRQSSFMIDRLGKSVFPDWLRLDERPHLQGALGSAPFDNEGVATRANDIVSDGVLQRYVLDSYAACKLGMVTTANAGGTHNVYVKNQDISFTELLEGMGDGLLVTELMGQGVNPVTGDYSRGASGFRIEKGEITYPVEEITVAGNLVDMYRDIAGISSDIDARGNLITGSIMIGNMTVAGD